MDFGKRVTAIYGLNLALSYENAAAERLEQRASQCIVPEAKKNLERHLKQTREQQERLKERIRALAGRGDSPDATTPTAESGRLPVPEPPRSFRNIMDEVGTEREMEVWESVNDLIVEKAEAVMYRAGIQALELLGADKKTIGALKKNLAEEEAFARWLEKNNPRIAKRLMKEQMRQGKKKRIAEIESVSTEAGEAAAADSTVAAAA
jgi:ferritin-like metal-binding protein YciE